MYLLNSDGISIVNSSLFCRTTFIVTIIEKKNSLIKESLFYATYFPLQFVDTFKMLESIVNISGMSFLINGQFKM